MTDSHLHDYAVKMVQTTLSCVDLTYPHESLEGTGLPGRETAQGGPLLLALKMLGVTSLGNVGGLQQPEMALG